VKKKNLLRKKVFIYIKNGKPRMTVQGSKSLYDDWRIACSKELNNGGVL
jgi:hypothetical protein